MKLVRGTQSERPLELEFGKDTVYERSNIRYIEEPDENGQRGFRGWEYNETQYTFAEWYQKDSLENKLAIAELAETILGGGQQ